MNQQTMVEAITKETLKVTTTTISQTTIKSIRLIHRLPMNQLQHHPRLQHLHTNRFLLHHRRRHLNQNTVTRTDLAMLLKTVRTTFKAAIMEMNTAVNPNHNIHCRLLSHHHLNLTTISLETITTSRLSPTTFTPPPVPRRRAL